MTALMWTVHCIVHMIQVFKYSTMIYTNHETNSIITTKIRFSTTNIDKFNLKFIRTSIYFFQFWFDVRHRFDKFNVISDVLNQLFMKFFNKRKKKQFKHKREKFRIRSNLCVCDHFDENVFWFPQKTVERLCQKYDMKKNQFYDTSINKSNRKKNE